MARYTLKMPREVYSGEHALGEIKNIVNNKVKKAVVFTDQVIRETGLLDISLSLLAEAGVETIVLDGLPAEPTCDQAQAIVDEFKKTEADFIVAVGGGSVMDVAKLASVLATETYNVRDLLHSPELAKKYVKTLMIPTTAGTGAEATPNSIVSVPERQMKVGIVNEAMIPDYVILDAVMIEKLPHDIAAATGADALAHAIECFTSKKANPFSDLFALKAIDLIFHHIEKACNTPIDMEAKNAMLTASFYAGVAITSSGTTGVHALSYPLGGTYHIPHGLSNAILLTPVMKFNEPACRRQLAQVYDTVCHITDGTKSMEEKSAWVIDQLEKIIKNLEIPSSLRQFDIGIEDIDDLVKKGMEVKRLLDNNRKIITPEDARKLYLEVI